MTLDIVCYLMIFTYKSLGGLVERGGLRLQLLLRLMPMDIGDKGQRK